MSLIYCLFGSLWNKLSLILWYEKSFVLYMLHILRRRVWVHIAIIPEFFYIYYLYETKWVRAY